VTRVLTAAAAPVPGASIALFRIAFGVLMVVDVGLYLPQLVTEYYVEPTFNFAYDPWGLVRPVPGAFGMHLVYLAKGLAAVLVALGLWYRPAAATFFVLTTYVFLLDSSFFQNHEYLISMLSLADPPAAHRMWSLDARRRPELAATPSRPGSCGSCASSSASRTSSAASRSSTRTGSPASRSGCGSPRVPTSRSIGRHLTNEAVVWFANHGSTVLDLTIVGFLLHRRTRVPAFVVAVTFHLLNARLFGLFVFPWLMIVATSMFFDPDWPLRVRDRWRAATSRRRDMEDPPVVAPPRTVRQPPRSPRRPTPPSTARRAHPTTDGCAPSSPASWRSGSRSR
jgi:vitamin K-dependent gamma-carboxylase